MYVLVTFNEDTQEVHVYEGPEGPWETIEHANRAVTLFIANSDKDFTSTFMTVTKIEKAA